MSLINNFDVLSDFYSDPQLKVLFKEEYKKKVPSKVMWALILFAHPESKFAGLDLASRRSLIEKDYLSSTLEWKKYEEIIEKIDRLLLTKTQRLLKGWENKLEERDAFIAAIPYNQETYDMLDKMMKETHKMWENYLAIQKKASQEADSQAQGDTELSLTEKKII